MDTQDWFTLLLFFVALLSALYARWTFNEAKKSNLIAIHKHQKEIFDAFVNFRSEFFQLGEQFKDETLFNLAITTFTADFYLSESLSNKLKEYSKIAHMINFEYKRIKHYEEGSHEVPEGLWDKIFAKTDRCHTLENEIDIELRNVLKLAKP